MKITEKTLSICFQLSTPFSQQFCVEKDPISLPLSPKLYRELYEKEKCIVRMICVTIKTSKHQYKD